MKMLAKILAVLVSVVVIVAFIRSVTGIKAAQGSVCPGTGNNLIANISPEALQNLRQDATGVPADCALTATFLFRKWDLQNALKLAAFFTAAKTYNILPVIRIASDNIDGPDAWQQIGPQEAAADASFLAQAITTSGYSQTVYASFGNEVNLDNEWGGTANAASYADSLIAFANAAAASGVPNLKVVIAPLSQAAGISANVYYQQLFDALVNKIGVPGCSGIIRCDATEKTLEWINSHIDGYAFNLYDHGTGNSQFILSDAKQIIEDLNAAGFPTANKVFIVTEIGVCDGSGACGISRPDVGIKSCQYFADLQTYDSRFIIATIFARDESERVTGFYYPTNSCSSATPYNPGRINLGGSTSHGSSVPLPNSDIPAYPPLGSLQICPPEIASDSKFGPWSSSTINPILPENNCGITPVPEPISCTTTMQKDGYCAIPFEDRAWCSPTACGSVDLKGKHFDNSCSKNPDGNAFCGKFLNTYCINDDGGPGFWLTRLKSGCNSLNNDDRGTIARCLGYFKNKPNQEQGIKENAQGLPACVPTYNAKANCVTECGEPVKVGEQLRISSALNNCLRSSTCRAQIALKDKAGGNSFMLPFASKLGDYFAGVLDAENQSPSSLDYLQNILNQAATSSGKEIQQVFNRAGVARKLLPTSVQDDLKCNFITYVKSRKASGQNTKYVERIGGKLTGLEFQVYDKKITDIKCPPKIADFIENDSKRGDFATAYSNWQKVYSKYWFGVPLFPNDDAQGEIQFVSPSVFGTLTDNSATGQNSSAVSGGGNAKFGPIHVSVPEIQRLAMATNIIQAILVPQENINQRNVLITSSDPLVLQKNLPTYGKTIDPKVYINACAPKSWGNFYNNTGQIIYDKTKNYRLDQDDSVGSEVEPGVDNQGNALTEYSRAVSCNVQNLTDSSGSKICTVGPFGELRCSKQDKVERSIEPGVQNYDETVQVRTVFPHLFDIAEQTISNGTGFLRIFKPETTPILNQINNSGVKQSLVTKDQFEKNYDPIPASVNNVYYYLPTSNGLAIDDTGHKENGWQIFFYKLGGLWNARNFVLKTLYPRL